MSNNVSVTLQAKDGEILKAFEALNRRIDQSAQKMNKMGRESEKASKKMGQGADFAGRKAIQSATALAGQFIGVGSAIGFAVDMAKMFEREREAILRRDRQRANAQLSLGEATAKVRDNFQGDESLPDSRLEARIRQAAKESGATQKNVAIALQSAFSAKGDASGEVAVKQVVEALRLDPSDPETAAMLASRALDIRKSSGITDPKALIGFIANIQRSARLVNIQSTGKNVVPAINALTSMGDTPEQAAELSALLTQLTGDEAGSVSSTGAVSLGTALSNFVVTRAAKGQFKGKFASRDARGDFSIPDAQVAAFEAAQGPTARLGVLQQSDELRRAFLGTTSFEKSLGIQTQIKDLVSGVPKVMAQFETIRSLIKDVSDPSQATVFESELQRKARGRFQPNVKIARETERNIEAFETADVTKGRRGEVRRAVDQILQRVNLPGFFDDDADTMFGKGPRVKALRRFDQMTGAKVFGEKSLVRTPLQGGIEILQEQVPRVGSEAERDLLREQIQSFKNLQEEMKRMREATERMEQNTRQGSRGKPPRPSASLGRQ